MELTFCLVADILGFRSLVMATDGTYQTTLVDEWIGLVDEVTHAAGLSRYQLISDSVFVPAPATSAGLDALLNVSQRLLEEGLYMRLPIRGAIARDLLRWSPDVAHGPAIVRAYEVGNLCDWIGITCDYAFPEMVGLWSWDRVVAYPPPLKNGATIVRPCVAWAIPEDVELIDHVSRDHSRVSVPDEVLSKVRNTSAFRSYMGRWSSQRPPEFSSRYPQ